MRKIKLQEVSSIFFKGWQMASLNRQDIKPKGSISIIFHTRTLPEKNCTYRYVISFWVKGIAHWEKQVAEKHIKYKLIVKNNVRPHLHLELPWTWKWYERFMPRYHGGNLKMCCSGGSLGESFVSWLSLHYFTYKHILLQSKRKIKIKKKKMYNFVFIQYSIN